MKYNYKNDITKWLEERSKRLEIPPNTILVPSSRELFFESKLYEIFLRYQSARMLITGINNNDNGYWVCEEDYNDIVRYNLNGLFLENMIINYNIVVDLTWVITCLSIEICHYENENKVKLDFNGINEINKTKEVIVKIEKIVKSPDVKESNVCFEYFNSLSPKYRYAINHIREFWDDFHNSEIRELYNFIKHRGKPEYTELYNIKGRKFYTYRINDEEIATDISDVRKNISFEDELIKLIKFDEDVLFPYCDRLFKLLIDIVY